MIPVKEGRWTTAAAAQARVVGRMRERGHSLQELRRAVREGRLAFGYVEDLLPGRERVLSRSEAAEQAGLEEALIERLMALLGTPTAIEGTLNDQDLVAMERIAEVLRAGFPLVALLQLIRVYAQSIRKIAEAEVRLFHLYVHEPLIRQGVDALQMAEEMEGLARDLLPITSPLMEYIHQRYLRFYIEQDVVGHMEAELGGQRQLGRVQMAFCFVDLTGFTRYTEEEGDEEAFDLVERFVETVEATLPAEATIVKTIGDEVMIVSPDPVTLTEWAVGFLTLFQERPQPRVGVHYGRAVYRDGDYFGTEVNLTHRVVARALGGEVMVTTAVVDGIGRSDYLEFDPIGEVDLKGFPQPVELFVARPRESDEAPADPATKIRGHGPQCSRDTGGGEHVRSPAWGPWAQTRRLTPWPRSCGAAGSSTRSPPGWCWSPAAPIPPARRRGWPVRSGRRTCTRCTSTTAFASRPIATSASAATSARGSASTSTSSARSTSMETSRPRRARPATRPRSSSAPARAATGSRPATRGPTSPRRCCTALPSRRERERCAACRRTAAASCGRCWRWSAPRRATSRPRPACHSPTTRRTSSSTSRATGSAPRCCRCCAS